MTQHPTTNVYVSYLFSVYERTYAQDPGPQLRRAHIMIHEDGWPSGHREWPVTAKSKTQTCGSRPWMWAGLRRSLAWTDDLCRLRGRRPGWRAAVRFAPAALAPTCLGAAAATPSVRTDAAQPVTLLLHTQQRGVDARHDGGFSLLEQLGTVPGGEFIRMPAEQCEFEPLPVRRHGLICSHPGHRAVVRRPWDIVHAETLGCRGQLEVLEESCQQRGRRISQLGNSEGLWGRWRQ